jgi:hypothetical protein
MYKILHLPTGTFVKYNLRKPTDWCFTSLESAKKVMTWEIVVDYDNDTVMLDEVMWYCTTKPVLNEHLQLVEVPDV